MRKFTEIIGILSLFIDIWDIVSFSISIAAGGGAVLTFLNNLPIIYPIGLIVIFLALIGLSVIRIITSYKRFLHTNNIVLDNALKILLEMHYSLAEYCIPISNYNLSIPKIKLISNQMSSSLGVTKEKFINKLNKRKDIMYLLNCAKKKYHVKSNKLLSLVPMLREFSILLDHYHVGLRVICEQEPYQNRSRELNKCLIKLDNPNSEISPIITKSKEFSIGLYSQLIGVSLIEKHPSVIKKYPERITDNIPRYTQSIHDIYTASLLELKKELIYLLKER